MTRRTVMTVCAAAGLTAAGVAAGNVMAGGGPAAPGVPASGPVVRTHTVAGPSVAGAEIAGKGGGGLKVIYRESDSTDVTVGPHAITAKKCPKNSSIVDGYYFKPSSSATSVFSQGGAPSGFLKWTFFLQNSSMSTQALKFGLICLK